LDSGRSQCANLSFSSWPLHMGRPRQRGLGRKSQHRRTALCVGDPGGLRRRGRRFLLVANRPIRMSTICAQNTASCIVSCGSDGKCFGQCPRCGRSIASPNRTRLGGADVVRRILNNLTTARAGGPGYGYGPGPYPDAVIVNPVTGRWCRTESNGYQICWTP